GIQRVDEFGAVFLRKRLAIGALAPGRQGLVDRKAELFGDGYERILVRRMQPAAADVEDDIRRGLDRVRPPADTVARLQHDHREAGILQCMRGPKARGARADDSDVNGGREGTHAQGSSTFEVMPEVVKLQPSSPANAGDPVFQRQWWLNRKAAAYWMPRIRGA